MIPKVIHHIGPKNKLKWHPIWEECYKSWKNIFSDYVFIFWNDTESLDSFIKETYPEWFNFYSQLPFHMMKMDFSRYAILNHYGGIYADLDVYCYENFHNDLTKSVCLIEPIVFEDNSEGELIMGCLMASEPNQPFWFDCMEMCKSVFLSENINQNDIFDNFSEILKVTGPKLLLNTYSNCNYKQNIQLLPQSHYHPSPISYFNGMKTKHFKTLTWGKEAISVYENAFKNLGIDYKTGMKTMFNDIRGINIDNFDFTKEY